jgi:type I restriction enzyme S subunit
MNRTPKFPALRFPEFHDPWVEKKLGEMLTLKNGLNAPKHAYGRGHRFINVLDIIENPVITHDVIKGSVDVPLADFEKNIVEYGDVLFQRSSETREEVGQANVYVDREQSATFGGFVIRGKKMADYDPLFINSLLRTSRARKDMTARSGGSTRYNIGQESIAAVSVSLPSLPEQKKIAAFLTAVDRRIEKLEQKRALLTDYKKGLMQQLFSQSLRFTAPDGSPFLPWQQKRLGEVFDEVTERVGKRSIQPYSISAGKGFVSQKERFGKDISGEQSEKYTYVSPGDFTYNKGNSKTYAYGCVYLNDLDKALSVPSVFISFRPSEPIATGYYAKLFEHHYLDRGLRRLISSSARMDGLLNVNKAHFFQLRIPVPSLPEQQKIADCLSAIDHKMEQVESQVAQSRQFKKGLLQRMFV